MKPGSSVTSPRSITAAPAGTARPEPAPRIFDPWTRTTALDTVASDRPSNILAARIAVTGAGVGDGTGDVWAARADAIPTPAARAKPTFTQPPSRPSPPSNDPHRPARRRSGRWRRR